MASLNLSSDEIKVLESYIDPSLDEHHPHEPLYGDDHDGQKHISVGTDRSAPVDQLPGAAARGDTLAAAAQEAGAGGGDASRRGAAAVAELRGDGGASKAAAWTAQRALWRWAQEYCDGRIAHYAQEETLQVYTAEERASGVENVRTGLRASLEDDEDDEDEDGDDDEEDDEDDDNDGRRGGEGGEKDAKTRAADAKEAARVAREKEEAKARRAAGMKLARNMVVGRFETPPNADWEAKRKMIGAGIGMARAPGR
ncbi:unnamed protein product [Parascedosporium putredinis]|uniref:Uncharacterized protein n=1 Tax=Parascedosporium putredinis TaxID=1442378 RepID=A0A9P1HA20_9PEZI|nr:unnamed protein product [Parascedosporium putredinis]CAI8003567.1 unnamed protein product [Parascedosporium putredinis]